MFHITIEPKQHIFSIQSLSLKSHSYFHLMRLKVKNNFNLWITCNLLYLGISGHLRTYSYIRLEQVSINILYQGIYLPYIRASIYPTLGQSSILKEQGMWMCGMQKKITSFGLVHATVTKFLVTYMFFLYTHTRCDHLKRK